MGVFVQFCWGYLMGCNLTKNSNPHLFLMGILEKGFSSKI